MTFYDTLAVYNVNNKADKGAVMKRFDDVMDTSNVYSYGIDLSKIKLDFSKSPKKHKAPAKRYVCIDLEMTEFSASQRCFVPGANGEVIQFGAVMLDENYNMLSEFSSYVKPVYSSVTPIINQLTGIINQNLEKPMTFLLYLINSATGVAKVTSQHSAGAKQTLISFGQNLKQKESTAMTFLELSKIL